MTEPESHALGDRFTNALEYVSYVHAAQRRKASDIPYVGHLLGVASILIDAGGTEDEVVAGLLHDAVEDQGGKQRARDIAARFGQRVAQIVVDCSDAIPEPGVQKEPYAQRKSKYREHLRRCSDPSVYLVSAADKLHNLRSMLRDYRFVGEKLWERFNAPKAENLANYAALIGIYQDGPQDPRRRPIVEELVELHRRLTDFGSENSGA
jgi:(p)ppGpp synthase/HD superfamily hydrolase